MAGMTAALVAAACSGDDDGGGGGGESAGSTTTSRPASDLAPLPGNHPPEDVPDADTIYGWIEEVFGQGIRRPGYDADIWAEGFVRDKFEELGLENVRFEPVPLKRWEPIEWSLEVIESPSGETRSLDCFPLPYTAPVDELELELAAFDEANPQSVAGKASLVDNAPLRLPPAFMSTASTTGDQLDLAQRVVDPEGTFEGQDHIVPFSSGLQEVAEPSMEAGARAFVGALLDYPGDSFEYMVPYDGIERDIPAVWIRGSDGEWLHEQLAQGPVRIRLRVDSTLEDFESNNVVGELPGADDDVVIVGSHHDGPWASAVEDSSGISLVLAQATFWAAQPVDKRPHRMMFVLNAGHMCGGAGLLKFLEDHEDELDGVVLEVHLEHAAMDFAENEAGELEPTGECVPRWFFTSRIPALEEAVQGALVDEELHRSMICAPNAISPQPPTDGAFFHNAGVPVMHFLAAPFYLFDSMDTLDKIDRDHLVPLSRATIRVIESTRGVSAADMRAGRLG
jgi:peptidase M28-like protein